jgi:hypothetical protein
MSMTLADAAELLRMEYAEMPGLALTLRQVQRLCNLSGELSDGALSILTESGFLRKNAQGYYVRHGSASPAAARIESCAKD